MGAIIGHADVRRMLARMRAEICAARAIALACAAALDMARATGLGEDTVRSLFKRVARHGDAWPVAHDHYFTAEAVAELARLVAELNARDGCARAATLRDQIGGGRKVAIHILEFFDRIGYTRRVRDTHLLRGSSAQFGS